MAAIGLIDCLVERGHHVCATAYTVTGRNLLRAERPSLVANLAPLDHPWCIDRVLSRMAPAVVVLVEAEIWPGWIAACRRRRIPVVVASGRISDRSLGRHRRVARWLRPTFARLSAVAARTQLDGERFVSLGVPESRVSVPGDLKFSGPTPDALASDLADRLHARTAVVFGSLHPGEESAVLAFLAAAQRAEHAVLAIVAPRHLSRVREIVRRIEAAGWRVLLRSELAGRDLGPGEVLVIDTIGELAALYGHASAAFVGGTFVPLGGHNLLEPLRAGCPVVCGPHIENVREVAESMQQRGAGRCVADPQEVAQVLMSWLSNPAQLERAGSEALEVARSDRGVAERIAKVIEAALAAPSAAD